MSYSLKFILCLCSILTLNACGPSKGQQAVDDANRSIENLKKQSADADVQAKKAGQASSKASDEAQKAYDSARDQTASGTQPAQVILSEAFVSGGQSSPKIEVTIASGKGWRGTTAPVLPNMLILDSNYKGIGPIASSTFGGTYINLGCDISKRADLVDLTEKKPTKLVSGISLKAEIVLLCDSKELGSDSVVILGSKVFLSNIQTARTGIYGASSFSLEADELELNGDNKISSVAPDGPSTLFSGPALTLKAATISGGGTLQISAIGANYIDPKK